VRGAGAIGTLLGMRRDSLAQAARPLVITADAELLDEVLRLAAKAGAELEVAPDVGAARSRYRAAPLILLGGDAVARACGRGCPGGARW
jgi:hypothetical protein